MPLMGEKDLISWTALIACYKQNKMYEEAFNSFMQMWYNGSNVDEIVIVSVLSACANLLVVKIGEVAHGMVVRNGFQSYLNLQNALIHMYSSCGEVVAAKKLFHSSCTLLGIPFAWLHEALATYLNYYGDFANALEHFLECGNWQKAHSIFMASVAHSLFLSAKHAEIWQLATSMAEIEDCDLGRQQFGQFSETLELFQQMLQENAKPDETTLVNVISACTGLIITTILAKITEVLSRTPTSSSAEATTMSLVPIKLNESNYALWSQVVEMYVSGKDKLGYINGDISQPSEDDPSFRKWRTENAIVKGWLINSMEQSLVGNFIRFTTARQVWDSMATTYFDGSDSSQVYDLCRRVSRMRQSGGSIKKYYNDLQGLWREIDFRHPNPMECAPDIRKYNSLLQDERVYVFLDGLDDRLDNIRSDVLQLKPFPNIEQAYVYVRREDTRQAVMVSKEELTSSGVVMATKGNTSDAPRLLQRGPGQKSKVQADGVGKCAHCGNSKHTKDNCFKLHGYPNWWHDLQVKKKGISTAGTEKRGHAAATVAMLSLSLIPVTENQASNDEGGYSQEEDNWAWY